MPIVQFPHPSLDQNGAVVSFPDETTEQATYFGRVDQLPPGSWCMLLSSRHLNERETLMARFFRHLQGHPDYRAAKAKRGHG
jgi:hypothetical protein